MTRKIHPSFCKNFCRTKVIKRERELCFYAIRLLFASKFYQTTFLIRPVCFVNFITFFLFFDYVAKNIAKRFTSKKS